MNKAELSQRVKQRATELGFNLVGIAPAVSPDGFHHLLEWLHQGYAGQMEYLARREAAYEHPRHVLESVRSVIMLGINYHTAEPPPAESHTGRVARYAWGSADYHDVLREKLRELAATLHELSPGCRTRGAVDTAPLLERDFARLAGLGWFGKNTMLLNKRIGSWFFLAGLLTDLELEPDQPHETSHCGTCTRCLQACPTAAFPQPYVLDASRCISYFTIELRDAVPTEFREELGDWLFGCDVCQEVCPWNSKAPVSREPAFQPVEMLRRIHLLELFSLSETEFRERFRHTPLERPKRSGLLRNAALVLGNQGDREAVPVLISALREPDAVVRGAVVWALGKIGGEAARSALQSQRELENIASVQTEIAQALQRLPTESCDD